MAVKAQDIAQVQYLLKQREERLLDVERVENGSIDCTIHGTYQWSYMDDDIQRMFRSLMDRHARRRLDQIDAQLKSLGFEIEREEDELL